MVDASVNGVTFPVFNDSAKSHTTVDTNVVEMRRYYEGQLDMKNKEILRFKSELDDMLQALGTL